MAPSSELGKLKANDKARRRSKRVKLAVPIVMSGKDNRGTEFHETTRTEIINKHGARIATNQDLALGGVVTIENRSLGLAAKATVVGIGKRRSPDAPVEIGVQLIKADNVWGVIFPPEDWEAELPPVEAEDLEGDAKSAAPTASASASPAPPASSVPPALGPQATVPGSLPPRATAPAGAAPPARPFAPAPVPVSGPSREQIDALSTAVLAKVTEHLDEALDTRVTDYTERLIRFTNQFALRVQADFQDAANRTEDQMVVLIKQKLGALADRVQASRTALEDLLGRCETIQKNAKTLADDAEQSIREASRQALESAAQELTANLREQIKGASAIVEAESQDRIRAAFSETVGATLAKADEHLSALMKDRLSQSDVELKVQQDRLIEGVKEKLNQIAVSGTTSLASRFEAMAVEMVPAMRLEMEKSLQESIGKVVARTTQSLQEQAQLLTQDALVSLQQAVQGLQGRLQEESRNIRQSAEQEINKTAEAFSRNVAQRADIAIDSVQSAAEQGSSKLRATQLESERSLRASVEEGQKQLTAISASALDRFQAGLQDLAREMQESVAETFTQRLQGAADELAATSAEKARQRVQDEIGAATETLSKEANRRLSAVADDFFASSSQELQARLRGQAEAHLDAVIQSASDKFSEHLRKLTQETGVALQTESRDELQKVAHTVLESSSEALRKEIEQSANRLQEDLKTFQQGLADQARQQLLGLTRATVETLNRHAGAGLEEFRSRLRKLGQESHEERLRDLEAKFREALEKQRAAMAAFLQQHGEQSRDLAALQIKTVSEQIVGKATEELDRQAGKSTRTLAELGEQARVGLENQIQKIEVEAKNSVWEYQRQIEQSNNAAVDRFRKETGALLDEVVFRLQDSVRSFQNAAANDVRGELQKASDNLLEVSAAEMRRQTERTLETITERLKEKEEEVVSDAANVFRSKIADIFAILQAGPKKPAELPDPDRVNKQS